MSGEGEGEGQWLGSERTSHSQSGVEIICESKLISRICHIRACRLPPCLPPSSCDRSCVEIAVPIRVRDRVRVRVRVSGQD